MSTTVLSWARLGISALGRFRDLNLSRNLKRTDSVLMGRGKYLGIHPVLPRRTKVMVGTAKTKAKRPRRKTADLTGPPVHVKVVIIVPRILSPSTIPHIPCVLSVWYLSRTSSSSKVHAHIRAALGPDGTPQSARAFETARHSSVYAVIA